MVGVQGDTWVERGTKAWVWEIPGWAILEYGGYMGREGYWGMSDSGMGACRLRRDARTWVWEILE